VRRIAEKRGEGERHTWEEERDTIMRTRETQSVGGEGQSRDKERTQSREVAWHSREKERD
jgi:hypothetical protein